MSISTAWSSVSGVERSLGIVRWTAAAATAFRSIRVQLQPGGAYAGFCEIVPSSTIIVTASGSEHDSCLIGATNEDSTLRRREERRKPVAVMVTMIKSAVIWGF